MRRCALFLVFAACTTEPPPQPTKPVTPPASAPASIPAAASLPVPTPDGTPIAASMPVALPVDLDALMQSAKKLPKRKYGKDVPKWAKTPITVQDGKIVAVGVAPSAKMNLQLARDAAENRARAMIVKLKQGKPELDPEPFTGTLEGAKMTNSFESKKDHNVYVQVEAPL